MGFLLTTVRFCLLAKRSGEGKSIHCTMMKWLQNNMEEVNKKCGPRSSFSYFLAWLWWIHLYFDWTTRRGEYENRFNSLTRFHYLQAIKKISSASLLCSILLLKQGVALSFHFIYIQEISLFKMGGHWCRNFGKLHCDRVNRMILF